MSASLEPATVVAVDLGAGSGRVCAVTAEGGRLGVSEVNRFTNRPVEAGGTLYWDILELWREVRAGLDLALPLRPDSVGVDSWGVDFALLDDRGELLGNPVHYRDSRTHGLLGELLERVPPELVFAATGIQFMPINTSVQLLSLARRQDPRLEAAKTLLMIPDVMHHWLCGASVGEHTNATTTQLFDPLARRWSPRMLEGIGVDERLFPAVVEPGTRLGEAQGVPVIAPATHDTASAVAAVPAEGSDFAYVSSGTWSLVGLEVDRPYLGPDALAENVTNEGGVLGTTRLLKNVAGLWILQQCLERWSGAGSRPSFAETVKAAATAAPLVASFDVDHRDFLTPGDHARLVREHCVARGMPAPSDLGGLARTIFESLAFAYRRALESVERVADRSAGVIHVVGGGARNALLCSLTAEATGRPVVAGPVEATVLGNAGVQMLGLGRLDGLGELRSAVRRSTRLRSYRPTQPRRTWDDAYVRWLEANVSQAAVAGDAGRA